MGLRTNIVGRDGRTTAEVTPFGQIVVAPLDFSRPATAQLAVAGVAVNLIEPLHGHSIVITDIMLSTSRTVGVNGADIVVFEGVTAETLIPIEVVFETDLAKSTFVPITGLNLGVPQGRFVNVTTSDVAVFITVMFYRVKGEILR